MDLEDLRSGGVKAIVNGLETDEEHWVTDVLQFPVLTHELQEDLVALDCGWCDTDLKIGQSVWMWGEPHGLSHVAVGSYCSEGCVSKRIDAYVEKYIQRDYLVRWRVH